MGTNTDNDYSAFYDQSLLTIDQNLRFHHVLNGLMV